MNSVVLLSGGLDSTVTMGIALDHEDRVVYPLIFDYGQRHRREVHSALDVFAWYRRKYQDRVFPAKIVTLPNVFHSSLTGTSLLPKNRHIDDSIPTTYVPARNSIFLAFAASYAESMMCNEIWVGFNAIDYSGYPDCRPEYVEAMGKALALGTKRGVEGNPIRIKAPIIAWSKSEIVQHGIVLEMPIELTWSCYEGGEKPCSECDSCVIRAAAFKVVGVEDGALL